MRRPFKSSSQTNLQQMRGRFFSYVYSHIFNQIYIWHSKSVLRISITGPYTVLQETISEEILCLFFSSLYWARINMYIIKLFIWVRNTYVYLGKINSLYLGEISRPNKRDCRIGHKSIYV